MSFLNFFLYGDKAANPKKDMKFTVRADSTKGDG